MQATFAEEPQSIVKYNIPSLDRFFASHLEHGAFISFMSPNKVGKSFWLMDFACQCDRVALAKSTDNWALTEHVCIYALGLMVVFGPVFALVNGALHWGTDWLTSRWTARLWKAEKRHDFFVAIGVDQMVHGCTLVLTAAWLL